MDTIRIPKRKRRGALSDRQRQALAAIRQRPRTTPELASLLGCELDAAADTATSLVRRGKVTRHPSAFPIRWAAR